MAALETHIATLLASQAPGTGQAKTSASARASSGVKRIEQVFEAARRRSRSVVLHDELQCPSAVLDAESGPTFGRRGFDGIAQDAPQGSANLRHVDMQGPVLWRIGTNQ